MFKRKELINLNDYFLDLQNRKSTSVYFYRIVGYNESIRDFILKYYEAARVSGVIIEGKIPNPDEKNLSYYDEMMGTNFKFDEAFIFQSLYKWLPRMNDVQRKQVTSSIYHTLEMMKKEGKNENMLKNAYIKFMCWLYYKFERILHQLGANTIPKILYEGDVSNYELKILSILSNAGCDVVLLQYHGDAFYQKLDPRNEISSLYQKVTTPFPKDFSLKALQNRQKLYGKPLEITNCTNAWMEGQILKDLLKPTKLRGNDQRFFYNGYCRMIGVEDKQNYLNELYQFQLEVKNSGRKLVILENEVLKPTMDEIAKISRRNYTNIEQMLYELSQNFKNSINNRLQPLLKKVFIDIMLEESKLVGMNINRLMNKAIYAICWLNRYMDYSMVIYLGGCRNENEALLFKILGRLPIDVLILVPDLNSKCCLVDQLLYEVHFEQSLVVEEFPRQNTTVQMGTTAYHAERELDTLMYQDSGMYRNQQYAKANSVNLLTMYEEISILWNQEMKYRPNFSVVDDVVNLPVICAKVLGVKGEDVATYWSKIRELVTEDTFVIRKAPFIDSLAENPFKGRCSQFFRNGQLRKQEIKNSKEYPFAFLREEIQNHLLDKLELLISQKTIQGTFENGMEFTIIATILNLNTELIRLIQKFDFTKVNPKLIYIATTEEMISLEDTILVAFLNLVGFDIVFLFRQVTRLKDDILIKKIMEEHQIGTYVYDLTVPNLNTGLSKSHRTWVDKLFKRGN
ncbi:hypothetical protein P261_01621 [Lachnospiraceae bacterium TWA4]|nr:hypothetical protein P261_01621 [Lachnospiraceae bacterium TWA4]